MKRILCLPLLFFFASMYGCASNSVSERDMAMAEHRLSIINSIHKDKKILAWDPAPPPKGGKRKYSIELAEKVETSCQGIFDEAVINIKNEVNLAKFSDSKEPYEKAKELAFNYSKDLENCAESQGAKAYFGLGANVSGGPYELGRWVDKIDLYNRRMKVIMAASEPRNENIATGIMIGLSILSAAYGHGYTNPSQHWVNGYFRSDGTYTSGHWRTNPNNTCSDNLSGCR